MWIRLNWSNFYISSFLSIWGPSLLSMFSLWWLKLLRLKIFCHHIEISNGRESLDRGNICKCNLWKGSRSNRPIIYQQPYIVSVNPDLICSVITKLQFLMITIYSLILSSKKSLYFNYFYLCLPSDSDCDKTFTYSICKLHYYEISVSAMIGKTGQRLKTYDLRM